MVRTTRLLNICFFSLVSLDSIWAQAAAPVAPAFDVASIELLRQSVASGLPYSGFLGTGGNPIKIAGNRVTLEGTLNIPIMAAYNVKDYQVTGGPPWADSDVFTIVAKTEGENTPKLEQGLDGEYDYSIEWSTESGDIKLAIMAAVQEQLGLKYEQAKEPADVLVIDHADKLSEN
jgi:hypothetical protein